MALTAGSKLGPYEIISPIGAGGMGEVYKARDTRLDRTVAIKVLPSHLSDTAELRERFEREARTISSLNHPNICVLHDIGRHDGVDFLVMEYLEGETLTERLAKGAMPLNDALKCAVEIAGALDKAHRQGVTHRDLKPGNIMLTKMGAKLLDFGLAKGRQPQGPTSNFSVMPTAASADLTAQGTILGTLQYMSPEQLEGQEADARSDIFAFGAVLYEMVTGHKAFQGKSQASLIGAILRDTPRPVTELQIVAPPSLDHLIATCLAKDPDDRWQTARDLWRELSAVAGAGHAKPVVASAAARRPMPPLRGLLVVIIVAGVAAVLGWKLKPAPLPVLPVARLAVTLPAGHELVNAGNASVDISSDGSKVAYTASQNGVQQIYIRAMDDLEPKALAGTENASAPFFSPDGQWVGFSQQGKLKKIPVTGGAIQVIVDSNGPGASWGADNNIYFSPSNTSGIWKVPASGGIPQELTKLDRGKGEISHRQPQLLPGGRGLLFSNWTGPEPDSRHTYLQVLKTGERRIVMQGAQTGRYVSTGHVVAVRERKLWAVPFDLANLTVSNSPPAPLPESVETTGETALFAVSLSGSLAYVFDNPAAADNRLMLVDRSGKAQSFPFPRTIVGVALSPDGRRAALESGGLGIFDFSRGSFVPIVPQTLGASQGPVWAPDGKHILYRGTRAGFRNLYWKTLDGTGEEERLTTGENTQTPGSFSEDGRWLAYSVNSQTGSTIWVLPLYGDRKPQPFLEKASNPHFSRDGHWLAYLSNVSGRSEVYATAFPGPGPKVQISTDGGLSPVWSRNGHELFYLNGDKMMAVDVVTQPTFNAGTPRVLFQGRYARSTTGISSFDVTPDGRFLMVPDPRPEQTATQLNIVLNWFRELQEHVPVK